MIKIYKTIVNVDVTEVEILDSLRHKIEKSNLPASELPDIPHRNEYSVLDLDNWALNAELSKKESEEVVELIERLFSLEVEVFYIKQQKEV